MKWAWKEMIKYDEANYKSVQATNAENLVHGTIKERKYIKILRLTLYNENVIGTAFTDMISDKPELEMLYITWIAHEINSNILQYFFRTIYENVPNIELFSLKLTLGKMNDNMEENREQKLQIFYDLRKNLKKLKKNQIRTRILTVPNQQKHLPKQKAQMQQKLLMLNKF